MHTTSCLRSRLWSSIWAASRRPRDPFSGFVGLPVLSHTACPSYLSSDRNVRQPGGPGGRSAPFSGGLEWTGRGGGKGGGAAATERRAAPTARKQGPAASQLSSSLCTVFACPNHGTAVSTVRLDVCTPVGVSASSRRACCPLLQVHDEVDESATTPRHSAAVLEVSPGRLHEATAWSEPLNPALSVRATAPAAEACPEAAAKPKSSDEATALRWPGRRGRHRRA